LKKKKKKSEMNFHHFANIRKAIDIKKRLLNVFYIFIFLNDIILQWVLGFVAKIYKYFNKFVVPYMAYNQNMAKCFYGWFFKKIKNLKK